MRSIGEWLPAEISPAEDMQAVARVGSWVSWIARGKKEKTDSAVTSQTLGAGRREDEAEDIEAEVTQGLFAKPG